MIPKKSVPDRLKEIGDAIKAGAKAERFQKELDYLLGTEMVERDELEEARWEEDYRNRETD